MKRRVLVIGFFDNVQLDIDSVTYRLQRRADQFWVEIFDWGRGAGKFETRPSSQVLHLQKRINLLTGSHHMQVCWVWSGNGNLQFILPFAYLIEAARWVPRDDTFLGQPTSNAGPAVEYSLHQLPYYRWAAASSGQFWQRGQPCG